MKNNCKQLHCNDVNGCMIIFKLNTLFDQALISDVERQNRELWIDRDGTDRDEFIQLKQIQDNIVNFINEGKNLYIHSNQSGNGKTSWALRLAQSYIKKI
jgi:hypothetical protein